MIEKTFKFILNILTGIALVIIIIFLFGNIWKILGNHNYNNYFGYTFFKVTSGSMGDAVKINDIIVVKITKDVKKNDIITFEDKNAFITHRIIKINDGFIITKGDANNSKDMAITEDKIVGKVVHILSGAGIWKEILTTPKILLSICLTIILFELAFSCDIKGKSDRQNGKIK